MTDLISLTGARLVEIHNGLVDESDRIKRWSKPKSVLVERIEGLRAEVEEPAEIANSLALVVDNDRGGEPEAGDAPRVTVKRAVLDAAADPQLSMREIADRVNSAHGFGTTARAAASIVCVFNRTASDEDRIPARIRKAKSAE